MNSRIFGAIGVAGSVCSIIGLVLMVWQMFHVAI